MQYSEKPTFLEYNFGEIDDVLNKDGSRISNISSLEVVRAVLSPSHNRSFIIGVFHPFSTDDNIERQREWLELESQKVHLSLKGVEDSYLNEMISIIYNKDRTEESELLKYLPEDHLSRIVLYQFDNKFPDYKNKGVDLRESLKRHKLTNIFKHFFMNDEELLSAKQDNGMLERAKKQYGLTRTEAFWKLLLSKSIENEFGSNNANPEQLEKIALFLEDVKKGDFGI